MEQGDGLVHSVEGDSRQVERLRAGGACADEYGVESLFEYAVDGVVVAAYGYAVAEFHSEGFDFLYLVAHH